MRVRAPRMKGRGGGGLEHQRCGKAYLRGGGVRAPMLRTLRISSHRGAILRSSVSKFPFKNSVTIVQTRDQLGGAGLIGHDTRSISTRREAAPGSAPVIPLGSGGGDAGLRAAALPAGGCCTSLAMSSLFRNENSLSIIDATSLMMGCVLEKVPGKCFPTSAAASPDAELTPGSQSTMSRTTVCSKLKTTFLIEI